MGDIALRSRGLGVVPALLVGVLGACGVALGHEEIEVGQSGAAGNPYVLHGDVDLISGAEPVVLMPEAGGPLDGYFLHDGPGFSSLMMEQPAENLFRLLAGHQTQLVRVAFDPGFVMLDPATLGPILAADGAAVDLNVGAVDNFSRIFLYGMLSGTPGGTIRSASFRLHDAAGLHADSGIFTLRFVAAPEPGGVGLVLGVLAVLRRR